MSQKRAVVVSAEVVPAYPVESMRGSTRLPLVTIQIQAAVRVRSVHYRQL